MRGIKIEEFNKLYETEPEVKEWFDTTYNAFIEIRDRSIIECKEKYSQYQLQILQGLHSLAESMFFERKKGFNRLMKWFERLSDYIEDHDFPEMKEPGLRNPIALEIYTWKYIVNEFSNIIKKDPGIKDKIIQNLQSQPFYKEKPLACLLEASLAGVWVSSEELSDTSEIPIENLNKKADNLIEEGLLTEEEFFKGDT